MANSAEIEGNQNIVIQGVSLSKIEITQHFDPKKFAKELEKLLIPKKPIFVLILTSTAQKLEKELTNIQDLGFSFSDIAKHYGEKERLGWKPYEQEDTILQILQSFEKAWEHPLNVILVDCLDKMPDQVFLDNVKLEMREIIWIVDNFALASEGNRHLMQFFDHIYIGACLIPYANSCVQNSKIKDFSQKMIQNTFPSLWNYTENHAGIFAGRIDNNLINIDLAIKDRNSFFKTLSNLIKHWLKVELKKSFGNAYSNSENKPAGEL